MSWSTHIAQKWEIPIPSAILSQTAALLSLSYCIISVSSVFCAVWLSDDSCRKFLGLIPAAFFESRRHRFPLCQMMFMWGSIYCPSCSFCPLTSQIYAVLVREWGPKADCTSGICLSRELALDAAEEHGFEGSRKGDMFPNCSPVLQHLSCLTPGKSGSDRWVTEQRRGWSVVSYNLVKVNLKDRQRESIAWISSLSSQDPLFGPFLIFFLCSWLVRFFLAYSNLDEFPLNTQRNGDEHQGLQS